MILHAVILRIIIVIVVVLVATFRIFNNMNMITIIVEIICFYFVNMIAMKFSMIIQNYCLKMHIV